MTPIKTMMLCFVFLISIVTIQAQDMAYVDSDLIVPQMDAYKKAQSEVQAFEQQLQKMLEAQQKKMQDFYEAEKADAINKTPNQQQEAEAKLQKMQQDLQTEAQAADRKLQEKEAELIEPVYKEFNAALEKVGKENNYSYVMDKKMLLYSGGGVDITDKVKAALGIK